MKNSFLLAKANLLKSKGNAISLTLVMLIVAMFINIGFVMMFGIGSFFERRAEELNTSHFIIDVSADEDFAAAQFNFLQNDARVESIDVHDFVMGIGFIEEVTTGGNGLLMFSPIVEDQQFNPLTLVGDYLPLTGDYVYIPHFMMIGANLN